MIRSRRGRSASCKPVRLELQKVLSEPFRYMKMKILLAACAVLAVLSCAACAQGGASTPVAGSAGSIQMYGTMDEGVSVRK
ncbi:hypothetical protein LMG29542_01982 [Paraburkholderia humisilvae]|uniref:Uncharacterized protein n=2 Tax=Paraburkholderia humisilvae TaxID=627669 RepID=A0A6J5DGA2_9BURK|nr:hypothetical protein LMG29542_01982 [Paraburkholderia humisilvae]